MDVLKIIVPAVLTFFVGVVITPFFTRYFYKYKMWKRSPRTESEEVKDGVVIPISDVFKGIHNTEHETSTPRIGGMIIWVSVFLTIYIIYVLSIIIPNDVTVKLNFFSRSQTVVPLAAFFFAAAVGLADDLLQIFGQGTYAKDGMIYRRVKILFVILISFSIAMWFYHKLDFSSIHLPFHGSWFLGLWFIPLFIVVTLATFSTSVIDGIDGLSGGVLATIFSALAIVAYVHAQTDIAALCATITGGILAFLWFNVPPARFYMGETGMLSLTVVLAVIAFLTDSVLLLPIIAFPLVITSFSVILQMGTYKLFNKKRLFKVAPLHHHFQALGWSREKIVMRYWIVSVIFAVIGVILALVG